MTKFLLIGLPTGVMKPGEKQWSLEAFSAALTSC